MHFREKPVAVMADIEAMFHQVKVSPEHRNALCFLWFKDGDQEQEPEIYRMTVHLFDVTWSPSCANFALRRTATDNQDTYSTGAETVKIVKDNFYVDDLLSLVDNTAAAVRLVRELCALLSHDRVNLRDWASNKADVLLGIEPDKWAKSVKSLDFDPTTHQQRKP